MTRIGGIRAFAALVTEISGICVICGSDDQDRRYLRHLRL
jgi:hypothetical protein